VHCACHPGRKKQRLREKTGCLRACAWAEYASKKKTIKTRRAVFIYCPEPRTASRENTLRYDGFVSGVCQDQETGLHQNRFRDYDPNGRYIEFDPIGLADGTNGYGYAKQNPLKFTDPMGLATCMFTIGEGRLICFPDDPNNAIVDIPVASGNNGGGTQCKNNPSCTGKSNRGPIPEGWWQWTNASTSKPNGRVLEPISGVTDPLNRDLFRTHSCLNPFGPSKGPRFCSAGCVTGTSKDIKELNKLLDAEPGSTLFVAP